VAAGPRAPHVLFCVGLEPGTISYNAAVSGCEKAARWQLAVGLLTRRPRHGLQPGTVSYNAAISACVKAGRWQLARGRLTRVLALAWSPTRQLQRCISACGAPWQLALGPLILMPRVRLEPGFVSYSASVSACEKAALWQLALELLAQLPRVGLEPDAVSCSAAISACGNAGQWQLALGLLTCVPRVGLESDTVCYAAAVSACEKAARRQLAFGLLARMPCVGLKPDIISCNAAIVACEKAAWWQLAFPAPHAHAPHQPGARLRLLRRCLRLLREAAQWPVASVPPPAMLLVMRCLHRHSRCAYLRCTSERPAAALASWLPSDAGHLGLRMLLPLLVPGEHRMLIR